MTSGHVVRTLIGKVAEGVFTTQTMFTANDKHIVHFHSGRSSVRVFRVDDGKLVHVRKNSHSPWCKLQLTQNLQIKIETIKGIPRQRQYSFVHCRLWFVYSSLWKTHRRTAERHLPYWIKRCYLSPLVRQACTQFTTAEGRKAVLTLVFVGYMSIWFTSPQSPFQRVTT